MKIINNKNNNKKGQFTVLLKKISKEFILDPVVNIKPLKLQPELTIITFSLKGYVINEIDINNNNNNNHNFIDKYNK